MYVLARDFDSSSNYEQAMLDTDTHELVEETTNWTIFVKKGPLIKVIVFSKGQWHHKGK